MQAGLVSLGWAQRFAFLTSSWEVSVLLVWATHWGTRSWTTQHFWEAHLPETAQLIGNTPHHKPYLDVTSGISPSFSFSILLLPCCGSWIPISLAGSTPVSSQGVMGWVVSPLKFKCWSPSPLTVLGDGIFKEVMKLECSHWGRLHSNPGTLKQLCYSPFCMIRLQKEGLHKINLHFHPPWDWNLIVNSV